MLRVMFVDDESNILNGLRRNLMSYRAVWDMVFVASGHEAIAELEQAPADVIVSDFRMPGMDGGQLLRTVRDRWPDTGRILLSGHTDERDLYNVLSVAQRFLDKPCDRVVLVTAIEHILRLRDALASQTIRAEIGSIDSLPSAQQTLDALVAVLEQDEPTIIQIADVVERDIGLTVKVLQLANSSLFGGAGQISSVRKALKNLGLQTVRSVALMRGLAEPAQSSGTISEPWLHRLNSHASLTAGIAGRLVAPEFRTEAFCAGLVEECGQLVFAACRPEALQRLLAASGTGSLDVRTEMAEFGVGHAQAGGYLLNLWGFPVSVVDAVATHDLTPNLLDPESKFLSVAEAVRMARGIVSQRVPNLCSTDANVALGTLQPTHQEYEDLLADPDWTPYDTTEGSQI